MQGAVEQALRLVVDILEEKNSMLNVPRNEQQWIHKSSERSLVMYVTWRATGKGFLDEEFLKFVLELTLYQTWNSQHQTFWRNRSTLIPRGKLNEELKWAESHKNGHPSKRAMKEAAVMSWRDGRLRSRRIWGGCCLKVVAGRTNKRLVVN